MLIIIFMDKLLKNKININQNIKENYCIIIISFS